VSVVLFSTPYAVKGMQEAFLILKTGTLWKSYAKANPIESANIDNYWNGGSRPDLVRTATGNALLGWADIYRGF
jgi:hypothetical protein